MSSSQTVKTHQNLKVRFWCPRQLQHECLHVAVAYYLNSDTDKVSLENLYTQICPHYLCPRENLNLWPLPSEGSALSGLSYEDSPLLRTTPELRQGKYTHNRSVLALPKLK